MPSGEEEPAAAKPLAGEKMPLLRRGLGGEATNAATSPLPSGFGSALELTDHSIEAPAGAALPSSRRLTSYTSEPPDTLLLMRQFAQLEAARLESAQAQEAQPPAGEQPLGGGAHGLPRLASRSTQGEGALPPHPHAAPSVGSVSGDLGLGGSQTLMPSLPFLPSLPSVPSLPTLSVTAPSSQRHSPQHSPRTPQGPVMEAAKGTSPLRAWRQPGQQQQQQQQIPQRGAGGHVRRRLGVQLLADPLAEQRGVANHKVAGDLFLAPQPGNAGGFKVPPLPPDMAADVLGLDKRARASPKQLRRSSRNVRRESNSENGDDEMDLNVELPEEGRAVPFYRKVPFWKAAGSILFTFAFTLAGTLMAVWQKNERVEGWFQWWRLLIFVATWVPLWWMGTLFGRAIIWVTEGHFFNHNAFYFLHTVRKPLVYVLRAALLLASWAATMYEPSFNDRDEPGNETIKRFYDAYIVITKLLGCVGLFFVTELVKVLLAKMISQKFNRESHIKKMQDALRQERYLHALLQARPSAWREAEAEEGKIDGEDEDEGGNGRGPWESGSLQPGPGKMSVGPMAGPPNLQRSSAPHPSQLKHSKHSLRSLFNGLARPWYGSTPPDVGMNNQVLHPISEGEEEEGGGTVVLNFDSPSKASTPPSRLGSGPFTYSPSKGAGGVVGSRSPTKSRRSSFSSDGPSTTIAAKAAQGGMKKAEDGLGGMTAGGLRRQGSQNVGALAKGQGTQSARVLTTHNAGAASLGDSSVHGGGMFKASARSAEAVKRSSSTSAGRQGVLGRPPTKKKGASLDTESTQSLLRKGQGAIAAKMARVEKHLRKKTLQVAFYDELSSTQRLEQVTSDVEAKRLAFYLFYNVKADFERPYIVIEDLEAFMSEKEAQGAFKMLDRSGNGKVSLAECASAVMHVFRDREYLAKSLKDMKSIVGKIAFMIGIGLHVFMFIIYLFILGVNGWKVFAAGVPILTALSFALGSSVKNAFDSSVFLFVTHPYDIGDIIIFNDTWYRVEEITLPCTVLLRTADAARIYYPNQMLISTPIHNATMSPQLFEITTFVVDGRTPYSVLEEMKQAVAKFAAERPQDYTGKCTAWFDLVKDSNRPNRLGIKLKIEYAFNLLSPRCLQARGAMFHMLLSRLAELKVDVTNVVQPYVMQQGAGA